MKKAKTRSSASADVRHSMARLTPEQKMYLDIVVWLEKKSQTELWREFIEERTEKWRREEPELFANLEQSFARRDALVLAKTQRQQNTGGAAKSR